MNTRKQFKKEREFLNDIVMNYANLEMKRFYNLDSSVYNEGSLSVKIKELMGLVASIVMRCEGCIKYHIIRCYEENIKDSELIESISIALIVGGSITIPHIREALKLWEQMKEKNE